MALPLGIQSAATGAMVFLPDVRPTKVPGGTPKTIPVVTPNQFGGDLASGSFGYFNAAAGVSRLYWLTDSNAVQDIWQMDDDAALNTALATIGEASNDPDVSFIILKSDGTLGS